LWSHFLSEAIFSTRHSYYSPSKVDFGKVKKRPEAENFDWLRQSAVFPLNTHTHIKLYKREAQEPNSADKLWKRRAVKVVINCALHSHSGRIAAASLVSGRVKKKSISPIENRTSAAATNTIRLSSLYLFISHLPAAAYFFF